MRKFLIFVFGIYFFLISFIPWGLLLLIKRKDKKITDDMQKFYDEMFMGFWTPIEKVLGTYEKPKPVVLENTAAFASEDIKAGDLCEIDLKSSKIKKMALSNRKIRDL